MRTFSIPEAITAQSNYCERKCFPNFAPSRGKCWKCGKNIYTQVIYNKGEKMEYATGISVEIAGESLITGCPHCSRSFCE